MFEIPVTAGWLLLFLLVAPAESVCVGHFIVAAKAPIGDYYSAPLASQAAMVVSLSVGQSVNQLSVIVVVVVVRLIA